MREAKLKQALEDAWAYIDARNKTRDVVKRRKVAEALQEGQRLREACLKAYPPEDDDDARRARAKMEKAFRAFESARRAYEALTALHRRATTSYDAAHEESHSDHSELRRSLGILEHKGGDQ